MRKYSDNGAAVSSEVNREIKKSYPQWNSSIHAITINAREQLDLYSIRWKGSSARIHVDSYHDIYLLIEFLSDRPCLREVKVSLIQKEDKIIKTWERVILTR